MADIFDLDPVDANNTTRAPEGMQFRNVNDAARALEGMISRWFRDEHFYLTASGSSGAYSVTANRTITSYADNLVVGFTANHTNPLGTATLAVSGLLPKQIVRPDGSALLPGDVVSGSKVLVVYVASTDKFQLLSLPATALSVSAMGVGTFMLWGTENVPSWALECTGQSLAVASYAALHAVLGYRYGGSGANFSLPNPRGYFLRFHDNAAGNDPGAATRTNRGDGTTGDAVGTKQDSGFQDHSHGAGTLAAVAVGDHGHPWLLNPDDDGTIGNTGGLMTTTVGVDETKSAFAGSPSASNGQQIGGGGAHGHTISGSTQAVGVPGGATETRAKNIAFKLIVVAVPALMLPQAAIGRNETFFGAEAMVARAANGAASGTRDSGSSDVTTAVFDFDKTTSEAVHFKWAPPKRWDRGTLTYQVYWTADAGSAAETLVFGLEGMALSNDDPTNGTFGTGGTASDALIATGDTHITAESNAFSVGGSPAIADLIIFSLFRSVSADNLDADARVLGVKLFWNSNATSDD